MQEEIDITEQQAIESLTNVVLREIPDQWELLEMEVPDPQPEVVPINFDGILDIKEELKNQKVRIPRAEGWDKQGNKTREDVREKYRTARRERAAGFDNKGHILAKRNELGTFTSPDGTVFITEDEFPYHVDESGDAKHYDVWVTGEIGPVVPATRVAGTIARFLHGKNLGENDFVLMQNPPPNKTLPEVEHLHLFTRVKPSLQ